MSREERIKELEDELKKTKYNKATQHHIGLLKAKIARLKQEIEKKKKGKGKRESYHIKKTGDATVVMVGFPSVGKSTLLNKLTNAESKVADYEFTTLNVIPGLLEYKHAKIQILDVPGIIEGASSGSGRGKEVLAAVRNADLILIIVDINNLWQIDVIEKELYNSGLRINEEKPDVKIIKTSKGGIDISSLVELDIEEETIKAILKEFKIINAHILIRSKIDAEKLIDVIEGNKKYVPALLIINKIDTVTKEVLKKIQEKWKEAIFISAEKVINLENLKEAIFNKLKFIRIYLKQPRREPDLSEPLILRKNSTLKELCLKIHKDFVEKFKFARIWGNSVRYDGQKITNLNKKLEDKDIVELHLK